VEDTVLINVKRELSRLRKLVYPVLQLTVKGVMQIIEENVSTVIKDSSFVEENASRIAQLELISKEILVITALTNALHVIMVTLVLDALKDMFYSMVNVERVVLLDSYQLMENVFHARTSMEQNNVDQLQLAYTNSIDGKILVFSYAQPILIQIIRIFVFHVEKDVKHASVQINVEIVKKDFIITMENAYPNVHQEQQQT
jgi:hypothetical protein